MRVIAGTKKGLTLQAVPGKHTRPTSDKVKESIFNMVGPFFDGGWALDLYAGTGGLGIEALSRGMEHVIFVDARRQAMQVVRNNLKAVKLQKQAETYINDANRALRAMKKRELQFDLIFLDPPYKEQKIVEQLEMMEQFHLLRPEATFVVEHDAALALPEQIGNIICDKQVTYGDTGITLFTYQKEEREK